ncbi:hypothetical protein CI109_101454 [Kwoniella shandongensis]|uniref:DUF6534 domain-containing protein n=1 Tax=Kwoniella shandongensis TaxID=1734106 RepID=A0A5M6BUN7_9TREE|nr:uncharacterized protein CI109_005150 [Kwoniella shandongensis]KAA5526574.1 hypothetical protein CI109_005150 [Kwoniella shandongensis]
MAGMLSLTDYQEELNAVAEFGIKQNIGLYLGPIILGFAFDCVLLGVMFNQLIQHFLLTPSDRRFNRIILVLSVLLAYGSTVLNLLMMFDWFAYGFGEWYRLFGLRYLKWVPLVDVGTVTTIQIFYLERAYQLHNKSKWVIFTVLPFILAGIGGAVGCTIKACLIPDSYYIVDLKPFFYTWLCSTVVAGIALTGMIAYKLIKSRTGWSDTDYLIGRLVRLSVESQLFPTLIAIAFMLSYGIKPVAGLNLFFEMFHPKVYVVAFLAVLNARKALREGLNPEPVIMFKKDTCKFDAKIPDLAMVDEPQMTYITEHNSVVPNLVVDLQRHSGEYDLPPRTGETVLSEDMLRIRTGVSERSDPFEALAVVGGSEVDLQQILRRGPISV